MIYGYMITAIGDDGLRYLLDEKFKTKNEAKNFVGKLKNSNARNPRISAITVKDGMKPKRIDIEVAYNVRAEGSEIEDDAFEGRETKYYHNRADAIKEFKRRITVVKNDGEDEDYKRTVIMNYVGGKSFHWSIRSGVKGL